MRKILLLESEDTVNGDYDNLHSPIMRDMTDADVVIAVIEDMKIRVIKSREMKCENVIGLDMLPSVTFGDQFIFNGYPDPKCIKQ
ncbi:MAG: hypothetical protein WC119_02850 [Synergistaceae bacterium]